MPTDQKKLYAISILLALLLLLLVFFSGGNGRWITAVLFIPATVAVVLLVKKRSVLSIHRRTVLLILTVIGVLYLMLLYLAGLSLGFERATVPFSLFAVTRFILPITLTVVGSEIVRYILLAQKRRAVDICAYVMGVATELLIVGGIGILTNFYAFMDYVGLALFPALFSNILYQYLSARYGALPNIAYRLLTTLYIYVIPYAPAIPDVLIVFSRLVVPLLAFWFLRALFEKKRRYASRHRKTTWPARLLAVLGVILAIALIMLVSGAPFLIFDVAPHRDIIIGFLTADAKCVEPLSKEIMISVFLYNSINCNKLVLPARFIVFAFVVRDSISLI